MILDRLPSFSSATYRLVGTAAALLQGVDLPAGDIDILVRRREDVDAFSAALQAFPCVTPPTDLGDAKQYFTEYVVVGVRAGASTVEYDETTGYAETAGTGPWTHVVHVPCGRHAVPCVALELRVATEIGRHRPGHCSALLQWLRHRGGDADLLRQALAARTRLSEEQRRAIVEQMRAGAPPV